MGEFVEFLHEVLAPFGAITTRRMFGGYGVYHDGLMFGLVADNTLYLKADKQTDPWFDELECEPFTYQKGIKSIRLSYRRAPDSIYDDPDEALQWARWAFSAALRASL
ncbi:TfoX/Sxy family protein [Gilvimarinus polysaccharolyticus]|uniref:TfoX/Sxy family protein n=1 Tax=Gilvimarinus polysaccharolyticus TaxID=863921 RepID=UPI0006739FD9|nr:TfoX/Sxy family protein [Gilvimarinus polysaccharolyticus]